MTLASESLPVAHSEVSKPSETLAPLDPEKILVPLSERIQALEAKVTTLSTRVEELETKLEKNLNRQNFEKTEISLPPTEHFGAPIMKPSAAQDRETFFTQDDATAIFRKGLMFFRTEKYSDSILALSEFVDKNKDHILAGAAQFYIGESYFKQKEYRLATQEYRQVLESYPQSVHISDTLGRLAIAQEAIKKHQESNRYRQLLSSIFPQSPAAAKDMTPPGVSEKIVTGSLSTQRPDPSLTLSDPPPTAPAPTEENHESGPLNVQLPNKGISRTKEIL